MNTETELLALAEKIGAKITQLKYYRDNECQLDHARAIAEGRISQANQIQHWISVLLNAPAQCTLASNATTISCSGKDITIACDDHDTKQAVMDALTGDGEPFGYYYWKSNGDGTESPDFSEREIPSFKCGVRDVVPLYAHPAPLADEAGMREALQLGLEAVTESFEHASTYDDQLLAEARHRSISTALRPSQAAAVLPGREEIAPVREIQMVSYESGVAEHAPSLWRIEIGGVSADFETKTWASNFRQAILALARPPELENEVIERWKDISTAPTDGTPVLLGWPGMHPLVGHYEDGFWGELDSDFGFEGFPTAPTYWQQLPAGPRALRREG